MHKYMKCLMQYHLGTKNLALSTGKKNYGNDKEVRKHFISEGWWE